MPMLNAYCSVHAFLTGAGKRLHTGISTFCPSQLRYRMLSWRACAPRGPQRMRPPPSRQPRPEKANTNVNKMWVNLFYTDSRRILSFYICFIPDSRRILSFYICFIPDSRRVLVGTPAHIGAARKRAAKHISNPDFGAILISDLWLTGQEEAL